VFPMSNMHTVVNHLLYADSTCVIGRSPADCQHLVDMVQKWLQWAHLKVKAPKSRSLSVQASTGKVMDPQLSVDGEAIPSV